MEYIHYGHKEFDINRFGEIKNQSYFTKPNGGLWGSPIGSQYNWKDWCKSNDFADCKENNSFTFKIKQDAKILIINSIDDCLSIPQTPDIYGNFISINVHCDYHQMIFPDFEKIAKQGYDAIRYNLSNDYRLYWILYGWDCDSILVLNKNIVEVI